MRGNRVHIFLHFNTLRHDIKELLNLTAMFVWLKYYLCLSMHKKFVYLSHIIFRLAIRVLLNTLVPRCVVWSLVVLTIVLPAIMRPDERRIRVRGSIHVSPRRNATRFGAVHRPYITKNPGAFFTNHIQGVGLC